MAWWTQGQLGVLQARPQTHPSRELRGSLLTSLTVGLLKCKCRTSGQVVGPSDSLELEKSKASMRPQGRERREGD